MPKKQKPYYLQKLGTGKKSRWNKRGKVNPQKIVMKAPIGKSLGFPKQNVFQLRYSTQVQLVDVTGGILDLHIFSANNVYDPDVTGTGHQPLGLDQIATYYNHYRVLSSKISARFTTTSVGSGQPVMTGIYLADDVNVPTSWTTLVEAGRSTPQMHTPGNTESHTLTAKYNQKAFFKGQGPNPSQLGAAIGVSPTDQAYYIIYCQAADETSTYVARSYTVSIDYLVNFSEPKDLPQS